MKENTKNMPVIALRGITILPGMMIHFDVSREISKKAIEEAMMGEQLVFIVTQKEEEKDAIQLEDLERVGTVSVVKQMIRLPGDILRVMVIGAERAVIDRLIESEPRLYGSIEYHQDHSMEKLTGLERNAMLQNLKELVQAYYEQDPKTGEKILKKLMDIDNLDKLVDETAVNLPLNLNRKQGILDRLDLADRYEYICIILAEEIQLNQIKKEFQSKVKEQVDKNQKEYLLREQMKVIREELGESGSVDDAEEYMEQLAALEASEEIKDKIKIEINRFRSISQNSSESAVVRGYIEMLLALPWNKGSQDNDNIKHAQSILEADHYGLEKVKTRILEFLAVRKLTGKGESPIICLVGPPGTGKTSIARSVARALDKQYVRICLGGVRDEAEIRGHRRTYVGAMPGRIILGLKSAGVKNPLMLLDEVDKVGNDQRGDTASALLEVLDAEQNSRFVDHYVELPVDLSEVLFIATANTTQTIPKPLLDRMELIEVTSYTENEKAHIAKEHLIEKQKAKNGLQKKQLSISGKAVNRIITGYTREAGVRNLERKIGEICRKAARELLEEDKTQIKVNDKNLDKYLGRVKYNIEEANEQDDTGIVRGLAWTSVGGDTLQIEVNVMPGKGNFELTGQLGDVMKESARTGISYIRSVSETYGIDREFYDKNDIHIHIPEGAVPKDGPSAGITMATAVLSAITGRKIRADVAMTGEITLRGRVLPVGGLKEKLLAARTAKIKMVLVPLKNKRDVEELDKEVVEGMEIRYIDSMEEVLKAAFVPSKQP